MGVNVYTTEELIQELVDFNQTHNRPPSSSEFGHRWKTFRYRFGSWNNALTAAGLPIFKYAEPQQLICTVCATSFNRPHNHKLTPTVFCSRTCKDHHDKTSLEYRTFRQELGTDIFKRAREQKPKYSYIAFNQCKVCNKWFSVRTSKQIGAKTCSKECRRKILSQNGLKVYQYTNKRSKKEIELGTLLQIDYPHIIFNYPMFNGWDADIIIPELKLAILWNGPWHYTKITKKHSLEQVKNRDLIKMNEIIKVGYSFLVVKDHRNKMTPGRAREIIEQLIATSTFNCSIF